MAFETIYFWDIDKGFAEVYRVLESGGEFLIVNEAKTVQGLEDSINAIGFTVYSAKEIETALYKAGFSEVKTYDHTNGRWLTVVAAK